jgi:hypothetical protein
MVFIGVILKPGHARSDRAPSNPLIQVKLTSSASINFSAISLPFSPKSFCPNHRSTEFYRVDPTGNASGVAINVRVGT